MTGNDFSSLSGFWTGVYDYPDNYAEPVPFNVVLIEVAGSLSGEIDEPNTFSPDTIGRLFARLTGSSDGTSVQFVKKYEKVREAGHNVHYDGAVNGDLTIIEGHWTVTDWMGSWSGPFIMNRSGHAKAEKRELGKEEGIFENIKSR